MSLLDKLKPGFWNVREDSSGPHRHLFNFRDIWKQTVCISASITLLPLIMLTIFDYTVTENAVKSESLLRTARFTSNTRRTVSFFLAERRFALDFIINDNSYAALNNAERLRAILENLQKSLTGFTDIGVIDASGIQHTYVGPFDLQGVDYSGQAWFREILDRGIYISDVFMGLRNRPHMVIAVRYTLPDGSFYILRASLHITRFEELISEVGGQGDAFLINHKGILQTQSRHFGNVLEKFPLPVPEFSLKTQVVETRGHKGEDIVMGYAYIKGTPFILMVATEKDELMAHWYTTRLKLIICLAVTIAIILLVILGIVTYLVSNIHMADQKRVMILHNIEYSDKMATIGKLAAGVAHEINNPLAIINEKAGLLQDIFSFTDRYKEDPKLMGLADAIVSSVERCAVITRRLLSFARKMEVEYQPIDLREIIHEVLGFLHKEAEYRCINISVNVSEALTGFESNRGKLQQVLLNIVKNAFAALETGGSLEINVTPEPEKSVLISICDNGCGIPAADIEHIFDPFFTTKSNRGGTGLGLSITYSLIQELGGSIIVTSHETQRTCFEVTLPLKPPEKKEK
ncbi:two-component sensor histidine kinase [Desulfonema ishimotonii]|uniref:histidine kinase n=1 Tax=Desulfonema ishimotonii TaxID=45657 RepID=A0A401FWC0_9BACT|nr:PAS domain-containing sensor histidine kinase [Desulfonema ishimotonii]GBC61243.1 two-component sensor histidine kinase [Desulfonema ishimotonii]